MWKYYYRQRQSLIDRLMYRTNYWLEVPVITSLLEKGIVVPLDGAVQAIWSSDKDEKGTC